MNTTRASVSGTLGALVCLSLLFASPAAGFAQTSSQPPPKAPVSAPPQAPRGAGQDDGGTTIDAPVPVPIKALNHTAIRDRWGVEIEGVEITAGGYMLNFRYRVIDAEKAKPLFVRKSQPLLKDEKSGEVMHVPVGPTTGALRNSNLPLQGRLYFMVFANPGKFLKKYDLVTITIGEFSVSNIVVR